MLLRGNKTPLIKDGFYDHLKVQFFYFTDNLSYQQFFGIKVNHKKTDEYIHRFIWCRK